VAYVAGVLTVNIYLHKLGITDFSFAKPKLVLTGIVVLFPILLLAARPILVAGGAVGRRARRESNSTLSPTMRFLAFLPLPALFAASWILCLERLSGLGQKIAVWHVLEHIREYTGQHIMLTDFLAAAMITIAIYSPIWVAAKLTFKSAQLLTHARSRTSTSQIVPERVYFPVVFALAMLFVIVYIYIFAITFYAAIPPAYGGGAPYFESFVIVDKGSSQLEELGIPFGNGQRDVTQPLPVLHESDVLVAVWLHDTTTDPPENKSHKNWNPVVIQIDKSLIGASMATDQPPKCQCPPPLGGVLMGIPKQIPAKNCHQIYA
jgi:hypothetical protein